MKKDILTAKIIKKHLQQIVRREFFDIVIALPIWGLIAASVAYLGYGFLKNRFGLGETGALIVSLIPAILVVAILIFKFFTALYKALLIHFGLYTVILDKVTGCGYEEGARTFDTFFFHNTRSEREDVIYFSSYGRYVVKDYDYIPDNFEREHVTFRRAASGDLIYLVMIDNNKEKIITIYHTETYDLEDGIKIQDNGVKVNND